MEEIFRDFWWLLFPLAFLVAGGFNAWLAERRRSDALRLLAAYAAQGKEPPAELLRSLEATRAEPVKG